MNIKAIILIFLCLISTVAVANETAYPNGEARTDNCRGVYDIARGTMEARQAGVSASELIESAERNFQAPWLDLVKSIILDAYENPLFSTSDQKERFISEFANSAYVYCMKS
ncbi:hypothetical protein ACSEE7_20150 [Halomonas cupida]|uniref:hypothetical protein n=1 Tax=Halomonas cupida TaxID=44933 RepID=UPI003EF89131